MGILVNVTKWKCPICHKTGKMWQSSWKSRKYGRQHLHRYHKDYKLEPILKVLRKEDVGDGE